MTVPSFRQSQLRPRPSTQLLARWLVAALALAAIADGFLFERSLTHLVVGHTVVLMLCALSFALLNSDQVGPDGQRRP